MHRVLLGSESGKSWSSPKGKADGALDQRGDWEASEHPCAVFQEAGVGQSCRIITTGNPWEEWPYPKGEWRVGTWDSQWWEVA